MEYPNNYICREASLEEVEQRWNEEQKKDPNNPLYQQAKEEFIEEIKNKTRKTYIGLLNNNIICDATIIIKPEGIKKEANNIEDLVTEKRSFLCGIRTNKEEENKGYFSKLLKHIEQDLLKEGVQELSLAVEDREQRTKDIYEHLGFNHYIRTEIKEGNGTIYTFHYYYKQIKTPQ